MKIKALHMRASGKEGGGGGGGGHISLAGEAFFVILSVYRVIYHSFVLSLASLPHTRGPCVCLDPDRRWHAVPGRDEIYTQGPGR